MMDADPTQFNVAWVDHGREPQNPPNPAHPDGIDICLGVPPPCCKVALPYPARRCGYFDVRCRRCGLSAMVTTAGHADDPRSITLSCQLTSN
jgi:hypothetical protein